MALPYKLLQSITIGDETMGLDPNLGKKYYDNRFTYIPNKSVRQNGAEITIDEPGVYAMVSSWGIQPSYTTAMRTIDVRFGLKRNGAAAYDYNTTKHTEYIKGNVENFISVPYIINLDESEVPCKIATSAMSDYGSNDNANFILAYKVAGGNTTP